MHMHTTWPCMGNQDIGFRIYTDTKGVRLQILHEVKCLTGDLFIVTIKISRQIQTPWFVGELLVNTDNYLQSQ